MVSFSFLNKDIKFTFSFLHIFDITNISFLCRMCCACNR